MELKDLEKYILTSTPPHFEDKPGVEPYRLYMDYSLGLADDSIIADLGTLQGLSALALSANEKVKVVSYDISLSKNIVQKENIELVEQNCFDEIEEILKSDLILIDIDPHDGLQEIKFYELLVERGYKGVTLWDDIHLNFGMRHFWSRVTHNKEDLTDKGHHSGTGLIIFE